MMIFESCLASLVLVVLDTGFFVFVRFALGFCVFAVSGALRFVPVLPLDGDFRVSASRSLLLDVLAVTALSSNCVCAVLLLRVDTMALSSRIGCMFLVVV
jgi:hypothetical protein